MSRMSDTSESVSNAVGQAQAELADRASQIGQNLRDMGSQARDAATGKYSELRDSASQYYEQGKERAQAWEHGLEEYVQEKPLQAVLIAAGIGVVLGLLWKRH